MIIKNKVGQIKKFGFEIGEGYTVLISLSEKLPSLDQAYIVRIHPAHEDSQLIKDESIEPIEFKGFVLKSLDFKEIKLKVDADVIKKVIDLKSKDISEFGISLESRSF